MEHEMILLDADFRSVCARLTIKRNATVAQVVEPPTRNRQVGSSSDPGSSKKVNDEHDA